MKACTGPTVTTEIPDRQSAPELAPEPLAGLCLKLTKCWRVLFGDALPSSKGSHGLGTWAVRACLNWTLPRIEASTRSGSPPGRSTSI